MVAHPHASTRLHGCRPADIAQAAALVDVNTALLTKLAEPTVPELCCNAVVQSIMSEIRSKLDATRSSAASMTSASTTFAPIARPQHGAFARLHEADEADSVSHNLMHGACLLAASTHARCRRRCCCCCCFWLWSSAHVAVYVQQYVAVYMSQYWGTILTYLCVLAHLQQGSRASFDTADLHNSASRDDV